MASQTQSGPKVTIIDRTGSDPGDPTPVGFGLAELVEAVDEANGEVERADYWTEVAADKHIVVGTTGDQVVEKLLDDSPADAEAVIFSRGSFDGGTAQVIGGTDGRGLMYALLEIAERIDARGLAVLEDIEDAVETPDNEVRGIDRFLMGPMEDEWFYDEDFWHYYLQRLARSRFNRFVLTTGHDTAFMSPPYPFFVDVPEYPDVRVTDEIDASREEHLNRLRRIGELCHRYGLEFVFGTWQQRPRSANRDMKDDGINQGLLVENLPLDDDEAFTDYCSRGLEELLVACPEIDGVQLRVNFESGVGDRSTAEQFWRELTAAPAAAAERRDRDVSLDIRAKGCTDNMIRWTQESGVDLTVSTKYWCESTGLSYHNTQMRRGELANLDDMNRARRYSYSDLLRKPRFFDVLYRMWVVGTNRIFLWGDPDYARRFSENAAFGGSRGFEILSPLGLKGGHYQIQESWPLFKDEELRHYEWEDERYWAWYLMFGRLGYSTETDADVWERQFEARFGEAATSVLDAYESASKILPLITAAHLTQHPTLHNWAELDTGGALFVENNSNPRFTDVTYLSAEPSDPAMFYQIDNYVRDVLAGDHQGKYTPLQVARWYDHLAEETRTAIDAATEGAEIANELEATALDMRMLADLATYHAEKTRAATALAFYHETGRPADLRDSDLYMRRAVEAWSSLAEHGEAAYHDDLLFAMGEPSADEGDWGDRLEEMEADLADLESLRREQGVDVADEPSDDGRITSLSIGTVADFPTTAIDISVPETHPAGEELTVDIAVSAVSDLEDVVLHYRHTNQLEGAFETVPMTEASRGYRATIPGEYLTAEWDLLVYITAVASDGNGVVAPGVFHPDESAPYHEVQIR